MGQIKNIKLHIVTDIKRGPSRNPTTNQKTNMSDMEDNDAPAPTPAPAAAAGPMDIFDAVQEILKLAMIHDGMARGLRESVKALDKRKALLCILANNCDEQTYVKLIEALCAEHGINLIKVDDNKKLGERAGLCKIDKEGNARKVVGCSCVVVRDWGKETQAHDAHGVLQEQEMNSTTCKG